jgi:hypothetical protein
MAYGVGAVLALLVCAAAGWAGFDRERGFYPTLLMVVASYYVLFAVMADTAWTLTVSETLLALVFVAAAIAGFKTTPWLIVAALAGHGLFDFIHHALIENPGVPLWWPGFCLSFDVLAAGFYAALLISRKPAAAGA